MPFADMETTRRSGDDSALDAWVRALEATAPIAKQPQRLLSDVIAGIARTHGDRPALISERETLTYQALTERANRYARWALKQNLGKGETTCLLMPNRPDYLAIWLGIASVGGVVSLLNAIARSVAGALHRHRRAAARDRRR